ncbi:MAG: Hypothetical protein AJITA_01031 [Acetilactobacillus jinshanensis]
MAGTTIFGAEVANKQVLTTPSAIPFAILAITLAVAGITIAKSVHLAKSTWGIP